MFCALPSYRKHISSKVVEKVLCPVRLTSGNYLQSDSQDLLDEKKKEACLQRKFVVKMYWLKEQDFKWLQKWGICWFSKCGFTAEVRMVRNRNPKANFFHIFGNNWKIRPVKAIKIRDGTTPWKPFIWHLICKNPPSGLRGDLQTKLGGRKKKRKIKKKNQSYFYSSPLTPSKQTNNVDCWPNVATPFML